MNLSRMLLATLMLSLCALSGSAWAETPGTTYCGPYTASAAISWSGQSNKTISGLQLSDITLNNCTNITITQCKIGPSTKNGVELNNCTNITVSDCRMEHIMTGVYAVSSHGVSVTHNEVKNVQGPFPRGQLCQFNQCSGAGLRVNYNIMENILGQSYAEDAINMWMTSGTASDPVQVIGNWIRGGGPSGSGGGLMMGDGGCSYLIAQDNILVDPGQYGIAIAGGDHIQLLNNKVFGKRQSFTNVGLYVWNQYSDPCNTHTVSGNQVKWTNKDGASNPAWNADNCGTVDGWSSNTWNANIDASILPAQILSDCVTTSALPGPVSKRLPAYATTLWYNLRGQQVSAAIAGRGLKTGVFLRVQKSPDALVNCTKTVNLP